MAGGDGTFSVAIQAAALSRRRLLR